MINRTTVRTRVVQTLFAYYQDEEKTPLTARKELLKSYADTYNLYFLLLDFANELTAYAQTSIDEMQARAKATHTPYQTNLRFVDNRFASQVFHDNALRNHLEQQHLSWDAGHSAVVSVYKALLNMDAYKDYMAQREVSYEDDKALWRRIYTDLLPDNEDMLSALDEMELKLDGGNWTTDLNMVLSYIVKTVKRSRSGEPLPLLPMFDNEPEVNFGPELLSYAIEHRPEYDELIARHLKNWEADRVAYMDKIILYIALAEIEHFPEIALQVSLNEYIEMAKEFSGEKSHLFINGILNEILLELRDGNKLLKAASLR
ncbi:MAG: transcription antitermination factor NusB [Paludibacteraceae bacterium]|nr:transcription antitermination factor NusB [Paludibacteraceae bacterium]